VGQTSQALTIDFSTPHCRQFPVQRLLSGSITSIAKEEHSLILIVRPAPQLDVAHGRGSAVGVRDDVVELEKRRLGAAPGATGESAPPLIAAPDLALDR
jgi:hypothetical protein